MATAAQPRGTGSRLRYEIIDAATSVLARLKDDESLFIACVAKQANISAPSVYIHFDDKAALLSTVLDQLNVEFAGLRDDADAAAMAAGGRQWARLLARCLAYVHFALERAGHYKVLYDGRALPHDDTMQVAPFGQPLLSRTADLIRELFPIQGPAMSDPDRVALLLWASLHGVGSMQINKTSIDWRTAQELTEQIFASTDSASSRVGFSTIAIVPILDMLQRG